LAARTILEATSALTALESWDKSSIEAAIRGLESALASKLRKFVSVLYVAMMGKAQGIPLFDSMELLGRERVLARLERALEIAEA
jgi:glutamyl-tRNA synthetase